MNQAEKNALISLCRIEVRRWKNCQDKQRSIFMVQLMEIALASLTAEPVAWWTGPEPTPTGELESVHDHETGSHWLPLICIDRPEIKPDKTMNSVKAPKQERGTFPPARIKQARDMEWIRAIRDAGGTVEESE